MMMFHFTSGKKGFFKTSTRDPEEDKRKCNSPQPAERETQEESNIRMPRLRMSHFNSGKSGYRSYDKKESAPPQPPPLPPRMSHFTSGKEGFSQHIPPEKELAQSLTGGKGVDEKIGSRHDAEKFTANRILVIKMLKMEQRLRMNEETQAMYDKQIWGGANIPPFNIEHDIQCKVLQDHGIPATPDNLDLYRSINGLYEDDPEVRQCVVYLSHDHSREGTLRVGMAWPDAELAGLDGHPLRLTDIYKDTSRPLVLIGASRS